MGNRDNWSYIQMPKRVFEEVENMLKAEEFVKKGIFKPKDIALILFRDFIENGSDMLDITSKVKRLQTEVDTMNSMWYMIIQNKLDKEMFANLKHKQTKDKETILVDSNINKEIKVTHKDNIPYCTHDKTNACIHTHYITIISKIINTKKSKS